MILFNLLPLFKARGINSPYKALVKFGFASATAHNILKNNTRTISLIHLEKLCILLNCTPHDLLHFVPQKELNIPGNHPLYELKKTNIDLNWTEEIKNLPLKDLNELIQLVKTKNEANQKP